MAKSNSIYEQPNVETAELFIVETLLKGGNVIIPDFGHLELKSLGERRTVLFKPAGSQDSLQRMMTANDVQSQNITNSLYTVISVPLKQEKIVNLPKIGVFRPFKHDNDEIQISFILSSYLRKLLSNEEIAIEEKKEKDIIDEVKETPIALERKNEEPKSETITEKVSVSTGSGKSKAEVTEKKSDTPSKPKSVSSYQYRGSKTGDILVTQDDVPEKSKSKSMIGTILLIVALFAIIVIIVYGLTKKGDEPLELAPQSESTDLPTLAKQHYGHPAFWIYIYDANSDKLSSPTNIPKQISNSLIFPDLKTEYDVDVTDSLEIQRANILTDIILNERKNNNK